jgi:hypothetical protein
VTEKCATPRQCGTLVQRPVAARWQLLPTYAGIFWEFLRHRQMDKQLIINQLCKQLL